MNQSLPQGIKAQPFNEKINSEDIPRWILTQVQTKQRQRQESIPWRNSMTRIIECEN